MQEKFYFFSFFFSFSMQLPGLTFSLHLKRGIQQKLAEMTQANFSFLVKQQRPTKIFKFFSYRTLLHLQGCQQKYRLFDKIDPIMTILCYVRLY